LRDVEDIDEDEKVSSRFAREVWRTRRGYKLRYSRGAFSKMTPAVNIDPFNSNTCASEDLQLLWQRLAHFNSSLCLVLGRSSIPGGRKSLERVSERDFPRPATFEQESSWGHYSSLTDEYETTSARPSISCLDSH
jgi:hypothetical protein